MDSAIGSRDFPGNQELCKIGLPCGYDSRKIVTIILVLYCQPLSSHLLQPLLLGELLSKAVGCEVDDDLDEYTANDGDDHDNDEADSLYISQGR